MPPMTVSDANMRKIRTDLIAAMHMVDSADSLLHFQLQIVEAIRTAELVDYDTPAEEKILRKHLHCLRLIGDALAWRCLHPHAIRQLAERPPCPPDKDLHGDSFVNVIHVASRLADKGLPVLLPDLTHCLQVANIVLPSDPESPALISCDPKVAEEPPLPFSSPEYDFSRLQGISRYLQSGRVTMPGEGHERVAIETNTPPEFNWPIVESLVDQARLSGHGSKIISPHELIFAYRWAGEAFIPPEIQNGHFDPKKKLIAVHSEALAKAWSSILPILDWPISPENRIALFEEDVILVHIFDPHALVGMSNGRARIVAIDSSKKEGQQGYVLDVDGSRAVASSRFTNQVLYGFRTASSIAAEMLETATSTRDRFIPPHS